MDDLPCRKCKTPNPATNQYCRSCGAVLQVSTSLIEAQPKTILPFVRRFRWKWFALGVPVILGTATLAMVGFAAIAFAIFDMSYRAGTLASLGSQAPWLAVAGCGAFLLAFVLGGLIVGRVARQRLIAEPALSSLFVLGVLAAVGTPVSRDAALVAAGFALPSAAAAGLGSWLGTVTQKKGSTR